MMSNTSQQEEDVVAQKFVIDTFWVSKKINRLYPQLTDDRLLALSKKNKSSPVDFLAVIMGCLGNRNKFAFDELEATIIAILEKKIDFVIALDPNEPND